MGSVGGGLHGSGGRVRLGPLLEIRSRSEQIAEPLSAEDQLVQSMPDVSPTKWHLAHTTWFFETFVLRRFHPEYSGFRPHYEVLFNSYYNSVGQQHPRPMRGMLSRPSLEEILEYRRVVDEALTELAEMGDVEEFAEVNALLELGGHHEQQHQELMLSDIKHVLFQNPSAPAYVARAAERSSFEPARAVGDARYLPIEGGLVSIGCQGGAFSFDNERPAHQAFLSDFALSERPLIVADVLEFIEAGGYADPLLWLSDGWAWRRDHQVDSPLYYTKQESGWSIFTHHGLEHADPSQVACHLTFFEADAMARFFGARLPTEFEWEHAARVQASPKGRRGSEEPSRSVPLMASGVWEWTSSAYLPYPGYRPAPGAVGEYNGKFMHNQMVLRGRSWATSRGHERVSYRNFFPSAAAWQFTGVRLARDA